MKAACCGLRGLEAEKDPIREAGREQLGRKKKKAVEAKRVFQGEGMLPLSVPLRVTEMKARGPWGLYHSWFDGVVGTGLMEGAQEKMRGRKRRQLGQSPVPGSFATERWSNEATGERGQRRMILR